MFITSLTETLKRYDPRSGFSISGQEYPAVGFFSSLHHGSDTSRPLSAFIPTRHGGRGQSTAESLSVLEELSYVSLPLSLIAGVNGALGGLMITEPGFGSDALNMQTSAVEESGAYRIRGRKHWGGLTGHADYWLITGRERKGERLDRNINFFVWDSAYGGVEVEEYYESLGLEEIPYGRSRIDTVIPAGNRMNPLASGVRMLLDVLHRSRLQFPGMAIGFTRRILDEARAHVRNRVVGGRTLPEYDQVQDRIAEIEAAYTTASAMCAYTAREVPIDRDCSPLALAANSIKTVVTDMMQAASQSLLQLVGAKGYRRDQYAGRATVDCRPFQIFEGSNDILYGQIAEAVLKGMRRTGPTRVSDYLASQDLTNRVADRVRRLFDFRVPGEGDRPLPQNRLVDLGRALGRVVSMQMVSDLGAQGFSAPLVKNATGTLTRSIARTLGSFRDGLAGTLAAISPSEDYLTDGRWRDVLSD